MLIFKKLIIFFNWPLAIIIKILAFIILLLKIYKGAPKIQLANFLLIFK
jgi:hypothetical protein